LRDKSTATIRSMPNATSNTLQGLNPGTTGRSAGKCSPPPAIHGCLAGLLRRFLLNADRLGDRVSAVRCFRHAWQTVLFHLADRVVRIHPIGRKPQTSEPGWHVALHKANAAPRCGARAKRTGGLPRKAAAMANGHCFHHGGKSTGPKTAEGLERSRKSN
jgi:hypothetical protein